MGGYINKYVLYVLVIILALFFVVLPVFCKYLTFTKTNGKVVDYGSYYTYIRHTQVLREYPIVRFETKDSIITIDCPAISASFMYKGETVGVIYNPKNELDAYVLNFVCLWGRKLIILSPFILFWSCIIFAFDFLPTRIYFKSTSKNAN